MTDTIDLIEANNIDLNEFFCSLHEDILEMYLQSICEFMKKDANYIKVKDIYTRYNNNLDAINAVVNLVGYFKFNDEDLLWLNKCLQCFFKKVNTRRQLSDSMKTELWNSQNRQCKYCKKALNFNEIRVDHIIPWDYVGDELANNYQILCSKCNGKKSNHVARTIHNLVF